MRHRKQTLQERRADLPDRGPVKASKKKAKPDRPFEVQQRRIGEPQAEFMRFLFDWHGVKKFVNYEQAEAWIAKELRSGINVMFPNRWEYRIIDTREQSEGNQEPCSLSE